MFLPGMPHIVWHIFYNTFWYEEIRTYARCAVAGCKHLWWKCGAFQDQQAILRA